MGKVEEEAVAAREALVELVADFDDDVAQRFLDGVLRPYPLSLSLALSLSLSLSVSLALTVNHTHTHTHKHV